MKVSLSILLTIVGTLLFVGTVRADELFDPAPATLETPRDDDATVLKRLTTNSDGKTPVVKNLDPTWIKTLADRGEPTLYTKDNSHGFDYIGMPIGGIGAGEVYLSGDGRLWNWDVFGLLCPAGFALEQGLAYVTPHVAGAEHDGTQWALDQGFVIRTRQGGQTATRTLDKNGFSDVTFSGQYPIGSVDYSDPASPVRVHLEAFSPFVPSQVQDSTYPATILNYTVENTSHEPVECTLGGWMENAAGISVRNQTAVLLENQVSRNAGGTTLNFAVKEAPAEGAAPTMFDDFESGKYDHWTVEGEAFGKQPVRQGEIRHTYAPQGTQGRFFIDSFIGRSDRPTGKLTSTAFTIDRPFITFLVGGGNDIKNECVELVVDGAVVRSATGRNDEILRSASWDVKEFQGKTAQLVIVDGSAGPWGHILVDNLAFADGPGLSIPLKNQSDVGSMALAMLGDPADAAAQVAGDKSSDAALDAPKADAAELKVADDTHKLVGALRRTRTLAPGEKMTVSFIVAWYFPNPLTLGLSTPMNRQYSTRFQSAEDVVAHLESDFDRLCAATRAWHDTWYDSTLPYYFLDRTFLNASTLATSTTYLLSDGRFYGYEGCYSCPGTCTHVWGYQQAIGYLFPDLEKALMEKAEFVTGIGMNAEGGIAMRAEWDRKPPVDGQSGIILRTYLAHRMSADSSFLQRNYPAVKKATDFLIAKFDPNHEGIMTGPQANTMDSAWFGKISWLSLYYQAALRAAAEMADESNDADYAKTLRATADKGRAYIETQLFNGEYFIHTADPAHPDSPGTYDGCPIEQLMGQNWAYEVGLGDIIDPAKAHTALDSMWKYNYTTDAGLYRNSFKAGRWYAMAGEPALIMCTFPTGNTDALKKGSAGFAAYDNESWSGSEYEAAAVMMWEGQVDKALAEVKSLQARYDAAKRNPWDECECGSHYSRAMSGYGVFTAACGFDYDGPKGTMAFAPRVQPENFKAAFTSAEGWGSFSQQYTATGMQAAVTVRYGQLRLKTLSLVLPAGSAAHSVRVQIGGKEQPASLRRQGDRVSVDFSSDVILPTGQTLDVVLGP